MRMVLNFSQIILLIVIILFRRGYSKEEKLIKSLTIFDDIKNKI
jgi:hypothetical protein